MVLVTLTLAFDLEPPHFVPRQRKDRSDASPALDHVKERKRHLSGEAALQDGALDTDCISMQPERRCRMGFKAGIGEDKRSRTIDLDQRPVGERRA
jgi:hypothetical protein